MLTQTRTWHPDETHPVKRYLMEYRAMLQRRDALLNELDRLREDATRATARLSGVPRARPADGDARESAMLRAVDGEARLLAITRHLDEALSARLALIEALPDERQKTLLTLRYINGMNWERIGHTMHYERTQVFAIHADAVAEAQRRLEGATGVAAAGAWGIEQGDETDADQQPT
ncbi:MAG: hypothetical protein GX418_00720 [Clostridiales bacterium]|nr:hypothetical protein [Clostridiales bacterium]